MNDKKLLTQHGLKWNPFSLQLPLEALQRAPLFDGFCHRVETLARGGGFALITGDPGTGKSSAMRLLAAHLGQLRDVRVGVLTRPQSHLADFYREMGELFGVTITPHNRWAGTKVLRERWQTHIGNALFRPVLLVDEAQEMLPNVLSELRLLSSVDLDSRLLLTVILAGDGRLQEKLRSDELLPLASRVRARLHLDAATPPMLAQFLRDALIAAGNPQLMTDELIKTLAEHAVGNHRVLVNLAAELLEVASQRGDLSRLDEKLYLELYAAPNKAGIAQRGRRSRS